MATARATLQRLNGGDAGASASDTQHQEPLQTEVKRHLDDLERRVAKPDSGSAPGSPFRCAQQLVVHRPQGSTRPMSWRGLATDRWCWETGQTWTAR